MSAEVRYLDLGDLRLQSGETLAGARLAYATYGTLSAARDNAVLVASAYGSTHADAEWLIAPGRALDPARWFTIATNLFGNGVSTSPSNAAPAQRGEAFPHVSIYDNVFTQQRLVADVLGIEQLALVTGFSMGAIQAYHWACAFPAAVARASPAWTGTTCWPCSRRGARPTSARWSVTPATGARRWARFERVPS